MRILYGVQGTGNGHLARARAMVPGLHNAGIDFDIVFSGREREDFFNMEVFGEYRSFSGLTLAINRGRVDPFKTVFNVKIGEFLRDIRQFDTADYDLVLTDFEPVSAWVARLRKIPCISLSHQSAFAYSVPKVNGYIASRLVMKTFAPSGMKVGLHWHHFDQPVLPPITEPLLSMPQTKNKILVYMGFEELDDIHEFLMPFEQYQFFVFARIAEPHREGHISFNPLSHSEFHRHLQDCAGVISNSGFELASECLVLGKKLLVKPIQGQFEQLSNALALQALGRGTVIQSLDQSILQEWLELPPHQPIAYPDVVGAISEWLPEFRQHSIESLARSLWEKTPMPYRYNPDIGNRLIPGLVV